jgi:hypothetical protein
MLVPAKSGVSGSSIDMTSTTGGLVPTPPNDPRKFLNGQAVFDYPLTGIIDIAKDSTVSADGITDDSAAIQAIINASTVNAVFYFSPSHAFNLNGTNLHSTHQCQAFISSPLGKAKILNGGIDLQHMGTSVYGLLFSGSTTYGVNMRPYHNGSTPETNAHIVVSSYAMDCVVDSCTFSENAVGINIQEAFGYGNIRNCRGGRNTTGILIDMFDLAADYGDVSISDSWFVGGTTGISVRKIGGLRLMNVKTQSCSSYGLSVVTHFVSSSWEGIHGIYAVACSFENAGIYDIYVSADSGCSTTQYPEGLTFSSCNAINIYLNKCTNFDYSGRVQTTFYQATTATNVRRAVSTAFGGVAPRSGAGTSYFDIMINDTNGPSIKVGTNLNLFNSTYPTGKIL